MKNQTQNQNILFLSSFLSERLWGSYYFRDIMKITSSNEKIGEMWSCSAIKNSESRIMNGPLKGKTLQEVYNTRPDLFAYPREKEFPLLIKLISSTDRTSVQVHPNDEYAFKNENSLGKTEGWLILDSKKDSTLIIGHNAKTKDELLSLINKDRIDDLLNTTKVKNGNFYPIPAGTLHALGKDMLILEVQQSSDITYRFYDYHRKDKNGNERELQIDKVMDVVSLKPYKEEVKNCNDIKNGLLFKNEYFSIRTVSVNEKHTITNNNEYLLVSIASGDFKLNNHELQLGETFIITALCKKTTILGSGRILITKKNN